MTWKVNANDPTWFWGDEDYLVRPELDDNARHVFTYGHCHAMALALRELRPEFELVGLDLHGEAYPEAPEHVAVRTKDGRLLDVYGVFGPGYKWHGASCCYMDEEDVWGLVEGELYREPHLESARALAPLVLQAAGL